MAELWMYPNDVYDVAVDWAPKQVLPGRGATLASVVVTVMDPQLGDVTGTLVAGSGVVGLVSYGTLHNPTLGKIYTVGHRATFTDGRVLERYITIEIQDPRAQAPVPLFKYPVDKFDVSLPWTGRFPRGATALGALVPAAYDLSEADVTSTYIDLASSQAVDPSSLVVVHGGVGGEEVLLEVQQAFDNGRVFNEYALLTVRVPPV